MIYNVILFCISLLFLFLGLVFLILNYFKTKHEKYDFRNHYIYELILQKKEKYYYFGVISIVIALLLLVGIYINFAFYKINIENSNILVVYFFCVVIGLFLILPILLVSLISMYNYKQHLIGDIILFLLSTLLSSCIAIIGFFSLMQGVDIKSLIIGSAAVIFIILSFIMIFNKNLLTWYKMGEKINDDGTKTYSRKKYFPLCYSEWIYIGFYYINTLLLIILFI